MNVFNLISAGGGKSEGLYIWKKSNCISGKTFKLTSTSGSRIYTISENEFNLSLINENNYIDFFKDFKMNTVNYFVVENGKLNIHEYTDGNTILEYRNDGTFYATNRVAPKNITYSMTRDNVYVTDFIGYVVSDKEDAYPDKAEKDGFYYEKFTSLDFGDMDITHLSAGEIMIASGTVNLEIVHNLGVNPKFAYIWTDDSTSNAYTIIRCAYVFRSPQYISGCGVWNIGASTSTTSVIQNYTKNSFYAGELTATGTNLYFEAGKKYKFVVLA